MDLARGAFDPRRYQICGMYDFLAGLRPKVFIK
jgi:hypothetical protein